MTIHIPQNFNEHAVKNFNPRWRDKYYWVVHSITFAQYLNKRSFDGWVNLNMEMLQKYLGSNYAKQVINELITSGVIETQPQYSKGAFSKNYRLREEFRDQPVQPDKLLKRTFTKKIARFKENYLKEVINQSPNTKAEFRNLTYFRIDVERARAYVRKVYHKNTAQYNSRMLAIHQYDEMHKADFRENRFSVNFFFKAVKGRIYSPATNLPRDLEQFTYVDGSKKDALVTLDAPNSQLCFADEFSKLEAQLIDSQGNENKVNNIRMYSGEMGENEEFASIELEENRTEIPYFPSSYSSTPYDIHFNLNSLISKGWRSCIFNSKGYEVMMSLIEYNGKEVGHSREERQEFKEVFFSQLFYNQYRESLTPMERVFREYFPDEFKALREAKKRYGNKGFAVKVQSLEGKFFHSIVVDTMRTRFKHVPFTIKHDSIKIQECYLSEVEPVLNNLLQTFFNDSRINLKRE